MAKDSKETFSPTLIQSFLYQNKSPLSAFGEGLFDVGKTNEQIHDTIWNHDLRKEQREREQFRFEMEKEAHELKMRREKHAAEADERYGFTDRELAQQQVKAGIANTNASTRATNTSTNITIDNRDRELLLALAVQEQRIDPENGEILEKGQMYLKSLESILNDPNKSLAQKEAAYQDSLLFKEVAGKRQVETLNNDTGELRQRESWLQEYYGLSLPRDGRKVVYNDLTNYCNALYTSFYNVSNQYNETFRKIIRGEIGIDDITDEQERFAFQQAHSNFLSMFKIPKNFESVKKKAEQLSSIVPRINAINTSFERMGNDSRILATLKANFGKVFGNDETDMQIVRTNFELLKMVVGRSQMAGALSDQDLKRVDAMLSHSWAENNSVLINLREYLANEVEDITTLTKTMPQVYKTAYFNGFLNRAKQVISKIDGRLNHGGVQSESKQRRAQNI